MPTNDFEKQVQQKMDELRFVPSDAVWLEVQKQIRQRRDRRRLLVWWLLLPLLAGGSVVLYHTYHTKNNIHSLSAVHRATAPAATTARAPGHDYAGNTAVPLSTQPVSPVNEPRKPAAGQGGDDNNSDHRVDGKARLHHNHRSPVSPVREGGADKAGAAINDKTITRPGMEQPVTSGGEQPEQASLKAAVVAAPGKKVFAPGMIKASPVVSPEEKATTKLHPFKKKMEWVVTLNGGNSGISSGFSPVVKTTPAYDQSFNSLSAGIPGGGVVTGGGQYAALSPRPSDIKPGLSAGLGLSLRRYMNKTLSLEAGIAYNYYSTSMLVGMQDTATAGAFSNYSFASVNRNIDYTNRYHFIEIPLRLQKQLGERSPFSLQTGLSIGRLLGSNALQYDAHRNIYYKDNGAFNKTQLSFSAGMDIRLLRGRPVSFEIGPRLQYGMTNFFKKEWYGSRHLLFAGLEARIFLQKK